MYNATQQAPVTTRKMLSECFSSFPHRFSSQSLGGFRLSFEPFSYKILVANTVTTTPDQSAMALPKNEPRCVLGSEKMYRQIHSSKIPIETMLSECSRKNACRCRAAAELAAGLSLISAPLPRGFGLSRRPPPRNKRPDFTGCGLYLES